MAPNTTVPVNKDPPATATPLPANPAASGLQIPSITLTPDALQLLLKESLVKYRDALLPAENKSHYILEFKSFEPPEFDGSSEDVEVAFDWISHIERLLKLFNFSDEQRVKCAVFMLKEHAFDWWRLVNLGQEGDGETRISWQQFKDMFFEHYCHDTAMYEKEMEFLTLKQGNMTVFEYENKFCRLSRFARVYVDTQAKRVHRFVMGLRKEIRGLVAVHCYQDYSSAAWAARTLEESVLVRSQPGHGHGSAGRKRRRGQFVRGP